MVKRVFSMANRRSFLNGEPKKLWLGCCGDEAREQFAGSCQWKVGGGPRQLQCTAIDHGRSLHLISTIPPSRLSTRSLYVCAVLEKLSALHPHESRPVVGALEPERLPCDNLKTGGISDATRPIAYFDVLVSRAMSRALHRTFIHDLHTRHLA